MTIIQSTPDDRRRTEDIVKGRKQEMKTYEETPSAKTLSKRATSKTMSVSMSEFAETVVQAGGGTSNELCFQQAFSSRTNISTSSSPQTSSVNSTLSGLHPPVNSVYPHRRIFPSIMSDLLSLSLFQLLSVISFLTSVFAVLRVGGSLHKLSNRFEHDVAHSPTDLPDGKSAMWSWSLSGLPVSFSLNTLIGDDESVNDETKDLEGYSDGSQELVLPLDWKAPKSSNRALPPMQFTQPPASMAKLIMSRHVQRKGHRVPRRMPGMPRPTPPSRLMHSSSQYSS